MKLLVNIDQKGSIRAGYDAPHSTQPAEIQVSEIPEDLRASVPTEHWPYGVHVRTILS